jgi:DNA polymerase III epsilon subunit-like protein
MPYFRNLLFVDTETTGLKPGLNETIEVGTMLTKPDGEIIEEWEAMMWPLRPETFSSEAKAVNGFDVRWDKAKCQPQEAVAAEFRRRASSGAPTLVGWNLDFDKGFLRNLMGMKLDDKDPWHWYTLDLKQAWYSHAVAGGRDDMKLQDVCGQLNIPYVNAHSAIGDARLTRLVWLKMLEQAKYADIRNFPQLAEG